MTLREFIEELEKYSDREEWLDMEIGLVSDSSDTIESIDYITTYHGAGSKKIGIVAKEQES